MPKLLVYILEAKNLLKLHILFHFSFRGLFGTNCIFSMVVYCDMSVHFFLPRLYLPTYTHGPPITISQVFSSHSILKVVPFTYNSTPNICFVGKKNVFDNILTYLFTYLHENIYLFIVIKITNSRLDFSL